MAQRQKAFLRLFGHGWRLARRAFLPKNAECGWSRDAEACLSPGSVKILVDRYACCFQNTSDLTREIGQKKAEDEDACRAWGVLPLARIVADPQQFRTYRREGPFGEGT